MPKFLKYHHNNLLHLLNIDDIIYIAPIYNPPPNLPIKSIITLKNAVQLYSDESVDTLFNEIKNLK
ncbi:hypothetical protein BTV59_06320 [Pasteurella multocida subsp. septica]|nr:hypothetical protein BTV60_06035 [Pasteurella multocida subsp. septica]OPD03858.1 hypothetical protein BTV56_04730 [Pasteurella multocida subsp. septica]OPD04894.1 hypothetical protein BTV52_06975 [Pasteurella multocida subsp. septica]OPD10530.1 hypothetical protein BTV59_06320 [Pasteurella multocida subsp. septica]OPD11259.1 hypothetical protein BTV64_07015 [Pasteurella multocida subsp. septica]